MKKNIMKTQPTEAGYEEIIITRNKLCDSGSRSHGNHNVYSSNYLENDYYKATRMQYAWVGGLAVAICDLTGPWANYLTRKFNFKVSHAFG